MLIYFRGAILSPHHTFQRPKLACLAQLALVAASVEQWRNLHHEEGSILQLDSPYAAEVPGEHNMVYQFDMWGNASYADFGIPQESWNGTIIPVTNFTIFHPSGKGVAAELGFFYTGGLPLGIFGLSSEHICKGTDHSCSAAATLADQGYTETNSVSVHLGSASLGYTGSLIFGGYDKGRAIGPAIDPNNLRLLDVIIGVETGGSPFPFAKQEGLLMTQDDQISGQPLSVSLDFTLPYIFLPQPTIDAITSNLPVYFDSQSKYYLWKQGDPLYRTVVTSPSYLGFVFLDSSNTDITIKVPFVLLNLTLVSAVSGLESNVSYLQLQPMVSSTYNSDYYFGRAVHQSVFISTYYDSGVAWLAQAPGPGQSNTGLGLEYQDIIVDTKNLQFHTGDHLFNESWAPAWTPLPLGRSQVNPDTSSPSSSGNAGLFGGAIAGIVVGAVVFVAFATAFVVILIRRRKNAAQGHATGQREAEQTGTPYNVDLKEAGGNGMAHEVANVERFEMAAGNDPKELPSHDHPYEMADKDQTQELPGECRGHEVSSSGSPVEKPASSIE